jgi:hypothetical protein
MKKVTWSYKRGVMNNYVLQELRKSWVILAYDPVILNVQELLVQCHCNILQDMYLQ